jgi:hypothetical protein
MGRRRERRATRAGGRRLCAAALASLGLVAVVSFGSPASAASTGGSNASGGADAAGTVWLCRPGLARNPCTASLTTTVVPASGKKTVVYSKPAANPTIDCFYVYPTVSEQQTPNANLTIDPEETAVAEAQASRFSQVCSVYAPMYPQLTLSAIGGKGLSAQAEATAYGGVLSAWKDYLAHYNRGRGVVLIGHSQGAAMLIALIKSQIDPKPAVRRRLVSALLMGGNVSVPVGRGVGGDFQHVAACETSSSLHCVVAYSSFLDPPPPDSLFGRVGQGVSSLSGQKAQATLQVLCSNPQSLTGARQLSPYFPTAQFPGILGTEAHLPAAPSTPWVTYPGLYRATCMTSGGATWLQVTPVGPPGDPRPVVTQSLGPTWGLHLVDVNIALGNLVSLVRDQAAAFAHAR